MICDLTAVTIMINIETGYELKSVPPVFRWLLYNSLSPDVKTTNKLGSVSSYETSM